MYVGYLHMGIILYAHVQVTHMYIKVNYYNASMYVATNFNPQAMESQNVTELTRMSVTSTGSACNQCFANCSSRDIPLCTTSQCMCIDTEICA